MALLPAEGGRARRPSAAEAELFDACACFFFLMCVYVRMWCFFNVCVCVYFFVMFLYVCMSVCFFFFECMYCFLMCVYVRMFVCVTRTTS